MRAKHSLPTLMIASTIAMGACTKPSYVSQRPEVERAVEPEVEEPLIPEETPRSRILALRNEVSGQVFSNITIEGQQISSATLIAVDDVGAEIAVAGETRKIPWASIPESLRDCWGHDPSVPILDSPALANPSPPEVDSPAANWPRAPSPEEAEIAAKKLRVAAAIKELGEKIEKTQSMIDEAKGFRSELTEIYAAEDKKAATMRAIRVYARMSQSSSCSSCAPPPPKSRLGGISTSLADREKMFNSLESQILFYERNLADDQARMEQYLAYAENLEN